MPARRARCSAASRCCQAASSASTGIRARRHCRSSHASRTIDAQPVARVLTQYNSGEVRRLAGRHTRDIESILGFSYGDTIVRRDDLVALESHA